MRVISGLYRSRNIKMVGIATTRETTDKVRGAIFNLISSYEMKGIALDLFAGSGAMGIEAISRGVEEVYFNDLNHKAYEVIKENLRSLGIKRGAVYNLDYRFFLKKCVKSFSFIFLDPPYALNVCDEIIEYVLENNLLKPLGLIICEIDKDVILKGYTGLEVYKERVYGIRKIVIFRRNQNA